MNDSTIIKAISKIHSAIIDLLVFIFLTLFTIYFTLHIGLKLDNVILPGLKIEQLYIKWDEKIAVHIDSIKITKSNTDSTFDFSDFNAKKVLKQSRILDSFFSEVNIRKITVNDINATFRYMEHQAGHIEVNGPTLNLLADIDMNRHLVLLSIKKFSESSTKTTLHGDIVADSDEHRIYGDIKINIAEALPLQLLLLADNKKVQLWGKGTSAITKEIDPVVKIAKLGPLIEPWIADYLKGSDLHIHYFKGTLYYDNPISLLDTLDVQAHYNGVKYTFSPGYAPAIAKCVDLAFKDRVLYIYPRNATFYGQPGGMTWLKIDFENPSNPLITVDVDTTARLTPELVTWLKGYHIALPFYQTQGSTKVKLTIWVTTADINVSANGTFSTKSATYNFSNTNIKVKNVKVNLNNTDVDIYSLNATLLENTIDADVTGKFNPVNENGRFDIVVNRAAFGKGQHALTLDTNESKLKFAYVLQPKREKLIIPKSHWLFNKRTITVNPLNAPFTFKNLNGKVPTTLVSMEDTLKAYVTGDFDIKKLKTDLSIDLLKLKTPSFNLDQSNTPLHVSYDNGLHVEVPESSNWKINGSTFTLNPSRFSYQQNVLNIENAHLAIDDLIDSQIYGSYNIKSGHGKLILKKLQAKMENQPLLDIDKDVKIYLHKNGDKRLVEVPVFNLKLRTDPNGWNMGIKNINYLSNYAPLLQEYNITAGSLHIKSTNDRAKINVDGNFSYPYKILVSNNKPIDLINFTGNYKENKLDLLFNQKIHFSLKHKRLKISAKEIGVALFPIFDFIEDHPVKENNSSKKSNFKISMQLDKSYLYINELRRAPADKLLLQYRDNNLNAQLLHGKDGGAALEYKDKKLFIYGDRLNDTFINGLTEFSDFKGGHLSFYFSGTTEKIDGVVKINNTIVKDYKAINNILAFVNTIPALVTFSIPHYSAKGLTMSEAYAGFTYTDHLLTIKGFHIDSPELQFNGTGLVDLNTKTVDVETSLVTEATSNLSKIPLLGYILVGKDDKTATTTITLSGPMDNPVVKNTLAKDIGVGSFNILKRALTFPVHYVEKAQKAIEKQNRNK